MSSRWNLLFDQIVCTKLTMRETQVVAAIARKTLGFYGREDGDRISASQIAKLTGISRAHVAETLLLLESRAIITRRDGGKGRASVISLNLEAAWTSKPVPKRVQVNLSRMEDRSASQPVPSRGQEPAPAPGHTIEKERKTKRVTTPPAGERALDVERIRKRAAEIYLAAGGSLELDKSRSVLFGQISNLVKNGVSEDTLLAGVRQLGKAREFPGYLKQRVQAIEEAGGPCVWDGLNRNALTLRQLRGCDCALCDEWAQAKAGQAAMSVSGGKVT